jgi:predicted transcriptional regulator
VEKSTAQERVLMPRPKPTRDDLKAREQLAIRVKKFAKENKFTEVKLADLAGISRRSVQMIKAAMVSPQRSNVEKLEKLFQTYENAAEITRLVKKRDSELGIKKSKRNRKVA